MRLLMMAVVALFAVGGVGCGDGPSYTYPTPKPPKPKPPVPADYSWTELPERPADGEMYDKGGDLQIITHFSTFGGNYTRNYSMLYDRVEKISYWVAYPMHKAWIDGSGSRDNIYRYDPEVDRTYQSSATSADGHGYGGGWQRGHQIAAADRNSSQEANIQTFYITNMTPQNGTLNSPYWAALEGWVRTKAKETTIPGGGRRYDTLYVVTGCWLGPNHRHIANRNNVAIPDAYYKVLLRTASGERAFPSDDDCQMIGFWMENRTPGSNDTYDKSVFSVADIEAKTGHKFFPSIKSDALKRECNPADWGQSKWTVNSMEN